MKQLPLSDSISIDREIAFSGKERDAESRLGDHGVRKYDYELGRFTSIDPLWEKYYEWTPYQYSACNPLSFYDDNGGVALTATGGAAAGGYIAGAGMVAAATWAYYEITNPGSTAGFFYTVGSAMNDAANDVGNLMTSDIGVSTDRTIYETTLASDATGVNIDYDLNMYNENKKLKIQVNSAVKQISEHLINLAGGGGPKKQKDRRDGTTDKWKKDINKQIGEINKKLKRLRKPFKQIMKETGRSESEVKQILDGLKQHNIKPPTGG